MEQNEYVQPVGERERAAAMAWTRLAEGEDSAAVRLVKEVGYARALDMLEEAVTRPDDDVVGLAESSHVARWTSRFNRDQFAADREKIESIGGFIMPGDPAWPEDIEYLGDQSPLGLWYRGDLRALAGARIAIVGSRAATPYGVTVTQDLAWELADAQVTIVSGGAFGVDAAAHRGALAADGRTVAVFAGGLDRPYPAAHTRLFREILEAGGLLLSENPPGSTSLRHRFLGRNRIIAGISQATLVTEAPYRSGALSTARHALSIGREVGAVPGPITSPASQGCHRLLREGAQCITSASEAQEMIGYQSIEAEPLPGLRSGDAVAHDPYATRVLDALPVRKGAAIADIARIAGLSIGEAMGGLGVAELHHLARNDGGLWRRVT